MAEIKLDAELRNEFGKGAARRIRRDNKIPAVLYGHGTEPLHLTLPGHETLLALRQANALLALQLADGAEHLALPKQVQRDPVKGIIEHVDLIAVRRGEKVTVEIPLLLVGEAADDTMVNQERTAVALRAEATAIPNDIELSIAGATVGMQFTAGDLVLPEGMELADDPEMLLVAISAQLTEEQLAAELEGGEEGEEMEAPEATAEPTGEETAE